MDDPMSRLVARCPVQPHTHVHCLPGEHMVKQQYGSLATVNHRMGSVKAMRRPPLPKWRARPPPLPIPGLHRKMRVHCPRVADSSIPLTCYPKSWLPAQCAIHASFGALEVARPGPAWLSMLNCALVECGVPFVPTSHSQPPLFWDPPIRPNSRGGPVPHRGVPTGPCFRLLAFVRRYPCRPISVWAFPQWPCLWLGKPVGQNPHAPTFPAHSFHPYPHIRVEFCLAGTYTFV